MYYRIEVCPSPVSPSPLAARLRNQARQVLNLQLDSVQVREVYSLFLDCDTAAAERIAAAFTSPVMQTVCLGETKPKTAFDWFLRIGFRPGVTDNVARSAASAAADILGRGLRRDEEIYTSTEYLIMAPELSREDAGRIAAELLANDLIQTTVVLSYAEWQRAGAPVNRPAVESTEEPRICEINLDVDDVELMRISREGVLALSLDEMKVIQAYFREQAPLRRQLGLPANPTDVELECLAQTWSEHCKHKIFNARINYTDENGKASVIDSCFKTFIRRSTAEVAKRVDWLLSVFHDNAGVIRFNDRLSLVYKVETHNSPTALDPYGGAMTGIVGVNRDPMGTGLGANLLLNIWGYCFASPFTDPKQVPAGLFHPRRLRDQVHAGVIDGGNQSGIPYANGWEYFDERFVGKPLVFCGTLGTLPAKIHDQPSHEKSISPGDWVVMTGGRIGKDGIHGATFSSEELHQDSPVQAVQIGDPITQKIMSDFLLEARDAKLYRFITDNGAGGLSSSLGEMSGISGGCRIELADAPLKYAGLQPWEILLSEAQERMSLAVPPEDLEAFIELAKRRNVEATVLGKFTDSGRFEVTYQGKLVASLGLDFLHDGLPQLDLQACWTPPCHPEPELDPQADLGKHIQKLLKRLNICSGEFKARQYDHEVKGLSVIKPYVGVNCNVASDATVSMIEPCSSDGVVLASGVAPRYSDIDTYHMMGAVIDTAIRRAIAVGADPGHMAGLDNFCWPDPVAAPGNPDGEYKLAQLVRANQALYDYTTAFQVPCISGKDSMKNDSTKGGRRISIPPTVLFSVVARIPDISKALSLGVKRAGDLVYIVGNTEAELGGSEYLAMLGAIGNKVPRLDAGQALAIYRDMAAVFDAEICDSAHAPALGGLAVGLAKMAIGGGRGIHVDLNAVPGTDGLNAAEILFSESCGRFLVTVAPAKQAALEAAMKNVPHALIGKVILDQELQVCRGVENICNVKLSKLVSAYTKPLNM